MVKTWLPEPPDGLQQCDEIQAIDDIVIPAADASDTDEEDVILYDGYEPLSLGIFLVFRIAAYSVKKTLQLITRLTEIYHPFNYST